MYIYIHIDILIYIPTYLRLTLTHLPVHASLYCSFTGGAARTYRRDTRRRSRHRRHVDSHRRRLPAAAAHLSRGAPPHGIPPRGIPPHSLPPRGIPSHGLRPYGIPPCDIPRYFRYTTRRPIRARTARRPPPVYLVVKGGRPPSTRRTRTRTGPWTSRSSFRGPCRSARDG